MSNIEKMQAAAQKAREQRKVDGIKIEQRNPLQKLDDNPKSLRRAVNAKCFDCEGQDADPCWKWRVGNCTCPSCPLFSVRPYQNMEGREMPPSVRENTNSERF